jgi:hypothetical protein
MFAFELPANGKGSRVVLNNVPEPKSGCTIGSFHRCRAVSRLKSVKVTQWLASDSTSPNESRAGY